MKYCCVYKFLEREIHEMKIVKECGDACEIDCWPYVGVSGGMNHGEILRVLNGYAFFCNMNILMSVSLCDDITSLYVQISQQSYKESILIR